MTKFYDQDGQVRKAVQRVMCDIDDMRERFDEDGQVLKVIQRALADINDMLSRMRNKGASEAEIEPINLFLSEYILKGKGPAIELGYRLARKLN